MDSPLLVVRVSDCESSGGQSREAVPLRRRRIEAVGRNFMVVDLGACWFVLALWLKSRRIVGA